MRLMSVEKYQLNQKKILDLIPNKNLKRENHTPKQLIELNNTIVKNIYMNGTNLIRLIVTKKSQEQTQTINNLTILPDSPLKVDYF